MTEQVPTGAAPRIEDSSIKGVGPRRARSRVLLWQAQQFVAVAVLAIGSYFFFSRCLVQSVTVVGMSMAPTLSNHEHYLLNRWVFHVRSPRRGDIVVIRDPSDNGFSVKRVVGVAGDTVSLERGAVYVNGHRLAEPYLPAGTSTFATSFEGRTFHCGSTHYFLLGDNRLNSVDSRNYGPVPRGNILGLVVR